MRLAGLAAVVFVGSAMAQPAEPPPAAAAEPDVELGVEKEVTLTIPEMVERGKITLPAMERSAGVVRRLLADAREKRDVVRVLCLNDKLNQMDLAIRTANDRGEALKAAAAQNNTDQTKHELTVINVLRDRVNTLLTEANQCVGEEAGFIGDTVLTVDIDPSIPSEEITRFPDDQVISEAPQLTSPTRFRRRP